jgi:hypothetical protein
MLFNNAYMKLVKLAKECPGLQVMITVGAIDRYRMSLFAGL